VTTSRPQAKDVSSSRVHEDADIANDTVLDGFYHHPKGPKKRIYIAESEDSSPLRVSPVDGEDDNTLYSVAPSLSELALPTHSVTKRYKHDEASQEEDDNSVEELETFLNNTVNLLKSSTLDTVK
jgi:hypothetical protein